MLSRGDAHDHPGFQAAFALIFASCIAVLFGADEQTETTHLPFSIPELIWELSLAIHLTFKGFKPDAPILQEASETGTRRGLREPATAGT